jgi:tyrosine decarboxylase/aspartate 1-decarboxylase
LETLGREGFRNAVQHCMNLIKHLYEGIEALGFEVLLRPTMNILAFRNSNPKILAENLRKNGWFVSYIPRLNCIRVVLMPHPTNQHLNKFLITLQHPNNQEN